jgi:hypothetical protein
MKLKTLFSMAGMSFLAVAALPAQLVAQGGSATPERNGGPHHYSLTDLGVVGPIPGQPISHRRRRPHCRQCRSRER